MAWTKETHRVYALEYHRVIRAGGDPAAARASAQRAASELPHDTLAPLAHGEKAPSRGWQKYVKVSGAQLVELDRVRDLEHVTLTAAFLGDPLPGRSALDRMSAEDRARFL